MKNAFFRYKLHHLIFWVLYICFWTFSYSRQTGLFYSFLMTMVWFIGQAGTFYITMYALIPYFFNKKRYVFFILCSVSVIFLSSAFISAGSLRIIKITDPTEVISFESFLFYGLIGCLTITILTVATKIIKDRIKNERRTQLLEKERTENELRFLRSQINPHFLFNAINSIYVLIKKDPDFAAHTLAKFADMLRYQLYECNADEIPIENEIAYMNNYIELEKLRKGKSVIVSSTIDESIKDFSIAPLLIIPFVENAFKYISASTDKPNTFTINIKYQNQFFVLLVENTTDKNIVVEKENIFSGIGLENVKRRLELIYKNRHTLQITTENNIYSVLLKIQIP